MIAPMPAGKTMGVRYRLVAALIVFVGLGASLAPVMAAERAGGSPRATAVDRGSAGAPAAAKSPVERGGGPTINAGGLNLDKAQLQARLQSGDFEAWGTEITITDRSVPLTLRWGKPLAPGSATIQVATHPFFVADSVIFVRTVTTQSKGENAWAQVSLDLSQVLPAQAPDSGATYHVRLVPQSSGLLATNRVTVAYRPPRSAAEFPIGAFYPQLFTPMPVFVDLQRLVIHEADEDNDEEPFIVPLVIYFDDTNMNLPDLANSSVRVRSHTSSPHESLPPYDELGAGDSVPIADSVGRFEESIVPLFFTQPQSTIEGYTKLFMPGVTETQLMRSTNVFVIVLAFEQDNTSAAAAAAARDAVIGFFDAELNRCLQEMTLPDVQNLARNGGSFQSVLVDANADLCGYQANEEDGTILHQLVTKLNGLAQDAAIAEELDDALQWFPHNPTLLGKLDHDDYIGFGWFSFNYEQVARARGPIGFSMHFEKTWIPTGQAGSTRAHYEIQGQVGRCAAPPAPGTTFCVPAFDAWVD